MAAHPPNAFSVPTSQFAAPPPIQGSSPQTAEFLLANYRLGKTLGIGSFGKVKIAEHITTQHKVAIKILNRKKVQSMDMEEKVRREIKILRLFMHPHIIRLYEVIETPTDFYVVMEYVKGGELFDYIVEKGRLTEDDARRFFQQIISGVEYCHRNMVVHRDLKPENLLLDSRHNVKIADFGLSNVMRDGHFLKTSCGSPNYAAPEVISGKLYAGPEVDVWSCGVILYALLCGSLPFDDENIPNLFKKIKGGVYQLPTHLSPGARDLIPKMLLVDPLKRITIPEIRQHFWFTQRLPRYLAVMQADSMGGHARVDEEVVAEVVAKVKGITRDHLIDSLHRRIQDKATVAYHLMLDNRKRLHSAGYLALELSETHHTTPPSTHPSQATGGGSHQHMGQPMHPGVMAGNSAVMQPQQLLLQQQQQQQQQRLVAERKWRLGAHGRGHPSFLMSVLYRALAANSVRWKKQTPYNLKCRVTVTLAPARLQSSAMAEDPPTPSEEGALALEAALDSASSPHGTAPMSPLSMDRNPSHEALPDSSSLPWGLPQPVRTSSAREVSMGDTDVEVDHLVKFEVQLYKVRDDEFVIDMQRLEGHHLIYMDVCGAILSSFPPHGAS